MKIQLPKGQRSKFIWIALGLFTLLLKQILSFFPTFVEYVYSRGLFQAVRWLFDYPLAWMPFALIYVLILGLVVSLVVGIRKLYQSEGSLWNKLLSGSLSLLAFLGGTIFFFFFLWGFNYSRVPIETYLNIDPQPLSLLELERELLEETEIITKLRSKIPGATDKALDDGYLPERLQRKLRQDLEFWLKSQGYPVSGRVRGRYMYPKGIFLYFSSAGLYFPFTGEGHLDAGLEAMQQVSVMTHELAHGYGFGDEGTCNFLAYVACASSDDPAIAYMGHLGHWRTLAVNYLRREPEKYKAFREKLPKGIIADLNAINENLQKYPDIMPKLRYQAYDAFLKAQGIKEGMANYNRVIMLVKAWRERREI